MRKSISILMALPVSASIASAQGATGLFSDFVPLRPDAPAQFRFEAFEDVDGDGNEDALAWWYRTHGEIIAWSFRFAGYGSAFVPYAGTTVSPDHGPLHPSEPHATTAADLNGDGRADLVAAIGREIVVMPARMGTSGVWYVSHQSSVALPFAYDSIERGIAAADFDGDGRDEVLLALAHQVQLYTSDANATLTLADFEAVHASSTTQRAPTIEIGDFDNDHELEAAVFSPDLDRISVFDVANVALGRPVTLRTAVGGERSQLAAGDLDGDGDDDLAVFKESVGGAPATYQIIRNAAAGELLPELPRLGGPAADLVDVDMDGDLDGVCCGGGSGPGTGDPNDSPSTFMVCLNDGTGVFDHAVAIAGIGGHRLAAAKDFDGDGDVDLIAGTGVLLNNMRVGAPYCQQSPNSTGVASTLTASGSALGDVPLTLEATNLPPNSLYLLVNGASQWTYSPIDVGGGTLCMPQDGFQRSNAGHSNSAGFAKIDLTSGAVNLPISSTTIGVPGMSDTISLQVWHRDLPTHGGSNLTNALGILVGP